MERYEMEEKFSKVFIKAVIMTAIIGTVGIVFNLFHREGANAFKVFTPPGELLRHDPRTIHSVEEIKTIWDSGKAIFIDSRPYEEFLKSHISGAFPLPYDQLDEFYPKIIRLLDPGYQIITYCDGAECLSSMHVADFLNQQGFPKVNIFFGGWELWEIKKYPSAAGEAF
jgi:rhodanese-related sulfurtransferase